MKKLVWAAACLLLGLALFGCRAEEKTEDTNVVKMMIPFANEVTDTDVWILPATEDNKKTSLWGKATLEKLPAGEEGAFSLEELGGSGLYLFRAIDTSGGFYAANDVFLDEGYSLRFTTEGGFSEAVLEVRDAQGVVVDTRSVFEGVL